MDPTVVRFRFGSKGMKFGSEGFPGERGGRVGWVHGYRKGVRPYG